MSKQIRIVLNYSQAFIDEVSESWDEASEVEKQEWVTAKALDFLDDTIDDVEIEFTEI